jgi:hypothetical protein
VGLQINTKFAFNNIRSFIDHAWGHYDLGFWGPVFLLYVPDGSEASVVPESLQKWRGEGVGRGVHHESRFISKCSFAGLFHAEQLGLSVS